MNRKLILVFYLKGEEAIGMAFLRQLLHLILTLVRWLISLVASTQWCSYASMDSKIRKVLVQLGLVHSHKRWLTRWLEGRPLFKTALLHRIK